MSEAPEVVILGRVLADLYPLQSETLLEDVRTFERFVGGYGGNVGIGLARLGVRTAVLSGVGDDGHGRFIAKTLAAEGVDTRWLVTHPTLRTALAFAELWPPDRFPLLAYRFPSCPDMEVRPADVPWPELAAAPLVYVSGTTLAQDPSRTTAIAILQARRAAGGGGGAGAGGRTTVLDLDWRPGYWLRPEDYPTWIRAAAGLADTIIGSESEFAAAGLTVDEALAAGVGRVYLKRGPEGAAIVTREGRLDVAGARVPVVNGLGAGDAFAAAVGWAMLRGEPPERQLHLGNAAGAIVASRLACSAAMPRADEVIAMADAAPG
ncbi:MAG: PfkB family carbohydrate kinase [Chloroflexota bacterium]